MAYQVLARKWRPGRFSELVGQEHVVSAITNALQNDRLHHAYLFTGTRGVGKTTIARIFSKSLNCEQGQSANPCGQCGTCQEIEQGNYVDLLEIDAASRTKVEDTRELLDNVQYKPTRGKFKVYLIDEVHMLSKHSFNALLKTLEEPPPHVKFLLATTDPQKLPITILSRCLQFNLKALSREQITQQLQHILEQESVSFEAPALSLLARAAQGSMRDALSLTDQAIAQGNNQVTASVVTDMLGLMDRQQVLKLLFAMVKRDASAVMAQIEDIAMMAPDFSQVLAEVASILHQVALTQWVPEACKLETTSAKAIYQLAKGLPAEQVQLLYQLALQGRKDLPFAGDGRSAFEMTILRMMTFAPVTPIDDAETVIANPPASGGATIQASPVAPEPETQHNSGNVTAPQASVEQIAAAPEPEANEQPQATAAPVQDNSVSVANAAAPSEPEVPQNEPAFQPQDEETQHLDAQAAQLMDEAEDFRRQSQVGPPDDHYDYPPESGGYDMPQDMPPQHFEPAGQIVEPESQQPSEPQPAAASTEAMLALRQRLKQQAMEDKASAAKKPPSEERTLQRPERPKPDASVESEAVGMEPRLEQSVPVAINEQERAISTNTETQAADEPPPWVTAGAEESFHTESVDSIVDTKEAPSELTTELSAAVDAQPDVQSQPDFSENNTPPVANEPQEVSTTQPTAIEFDSDLPPYLENGDKLLHASQIDKWSALIEAMPIAGLLKQIALNSRFAKEGENVTMTLDPSQEHLVNDGTVPQLTEALNSVLSKPVNVTLVYGNVEKTPYQIQQQINQMRKQYARQVIQQDDTILAMIGAFNAEVVQDSIEPR